MKTSTKSLLALVFAAIGLSLSAQPRYGGNDPRQGNNQNQNQNQNNNAWASSGSNNDSKRGGHVNISINAGYPGGYYGNNYGYTYGYNNYYGNNYGYYNMKKAARNSIHQAAGIIGQAMQFTDWNDMYSPWLAKAIRHQQYARDLYYWGDYAGALNHAERASYLAWNTLSYFSNGYSYGYNNYGGGSYSYPDPYSDPNNPYYRQNSSSNQPMNSPTYDDNGYDYGNANRRSATNNASGNTNSSANTRSAAPVQKLEADKLDDNLPQSKLNDRDLLKMSAKNLDIE